MGARPRSCCTSLRHFQLRRRGGKGTRDGAPPVVERDVLRRSCAAPEGRFAQARYGSDRDIFFDVATSKSHPELWKRLVEDFGPNRKKNNKWPDVAFSNAFIGNYLRFECLSKAGLSAQILDEAKGYFSFMAERGRCGSMTRPPPVVRMALRATSPMFSTAMSSA